MNELPAIETIGISQREIFAKMVEAMRVSLIDPKTDILLTPFGGSEEEIEFLVRIFNDKIMRRRFYPTTPRDPDAIRALVNTWTADPQGIHWGIYSPVHEDGNRTLVGRIGINFQGDFFPLDPEMNFVFFIDHEKQNNGFASNSVGIILAHLQNCGFRKVVGVTQESNTASYMVLGKWMQQIHTHRHAVYFERYLNR